MLFNLGRKLPNVLERTPVRVTVLLIILWVMVFVVFAGTAAKLSIVGSPEMRRGASVTR